jgi:Rps23 Pro-64 3,4-dihydroxylase Tpa1-like proline 4-hydroxylase
LRKLTVITYLNPQLESVKSPGELRLFLPSCIVDVVPHMGRTIAFKSEYVEHEVRPTLGYQRFALTTWFHHTWQPQQVDKVQIKN